MNTNKFKNKQCAAGFSLVEIMVAVFILGMMATMGALSVRQILPQMRGDRASSRLAFQLQLSRSEAIASNKMIRVTLNTDTNDFESWIDRDGDGNKDADETTSVTLISPDLVEIRSGWDSGMFNAFGQFILTPGQREIKTVSTKFLPAGSTDQVELILRGSGAITKR